MPGTYEPIATTTLGSSAASYTFTGIPATYTDLILIISGGLVGTGQFRLQVGSGSIDTGASYSGTQIYGFASTIGGGQEVNATNPYLGGASSGRSVRMIQFMSYSNTNVFKSWTLKSGDGGNQYDTQASLWRSTSAINQVRINTLTNDIASGTSLTLYGIKAA
jgi:hypothetical protein